MARVCEELFPLGSYPGQKLPGFYMDNYLKQQLDIMLKNITDDWDFTIIVSGQGEVRVGKSVLAMQIGCYWSYMIQKLYGFKVPFSCKSNFVFNGEKLIDTGNFLGQNHPYSVLQYDEAGADLEGRKTMRTVTQNVLDYFRECGQYNMLNILVIPEFFDLPKTIALSRSIFLLDVFYTSDKEGKFKRGYYKFFSKRNKKGLFLKGKRDLNYHAEHWNFQGIFDNIYTINKTEYKSMKQEALSERGKTKREKAIIQRDFAWYLLTEEFGMSQEDITKKMKESIKMVITRATISAAVLKMKEEIEILKNRKVQNTNEYYYNMSDKENIEGLPLEADNAV